MTLPDSFGQKQWWMALMRDLWRRRLVDFFVCLGIVLSAARLQGQRSGQQAQAVSAELHGQVRIHNQPAPQGILVLLDAAPGMQSDLVGSGQMSRTMTDSAGKFLFDQVPVVHGQQEKFLGANGRTPGLLFEKATKLEPGNASAFLGIGAAMNQQQDFSAAIKPLARSLEINANSAEAHYEIGRSLWGLQKWQDAEPHARQSPKLNKEFAPAHVLMGNIYLRHRDANSALQEFQEYLRLDPQGEHAAAVQELIDKIQKALRQ
jgi:tetratricopeptide (TPR) repeat protein